MRYFLYSLLLSCLVFSEAWAYRVNYETRDVVRNIKALQVEIEKQEGHSPDVMITDKIGMKFLKMNVFFHQIILNSLTKSNN